MINVIVIGTIVTMRNIVMMDRMKAEPVKHGKHGINLILKRLRDISTNVPRQVLVFHAFKNNVSCFFSKYKKESFLLFKNIVDKHIFKNLFSF